MRRVDPRLARWGWVGHGCGPLFSNTSCARLIVQAVPSGMPEDCKVPVTAGAD